MSELTSGSYDVYSTFQRGKIQVHLQSLLRSGPLYSTGSVGWSSGRDERLNRDVTHRGIFFVRHGGQRRQDKLQHPVPARRQHLAAVQQLGPAVLGGVGHRPTPPGYQAPVGTMANNISWYSTWSISSLIRSSAGRAWRTVN